MKERIKIRFVLLVTAIYILIFGIFALRKGNMEFLK
jgi:hypothetical protein|tara:strand:- start:129 stop:236 length:108 start_codon:yes stop_codon:yes gene_type:complete